MASNLTAEELTFQEVSQLNDRKQALKHSYTTYLGSKPEIRSIMNDFMCAVLLEKPDNVVEFAQQHFGAIQAEQRPEAAGTIVPLVLTGPMGAGRHTLLKKLVKLLPDLFDAPLPHVSREPVAALGEVDGETAHFVTLDVMTVDIDNGKFFSFERDASGVISGISFEAIDQVLSQHRIPILILPVNQIYDVKRSGRFPGMKAVFVRPHEIDAIEARLKERGTDTMEAITEAIHRAEMEVALAKNPEFDRVVVNAVVETAFAELKTALTEWYPHVRKVLEKH